MRILPFLLQCLLLASAPALAQTQPQSGNAAPVVHAAPPMPVQQGGPKSALGHSQPGKPTPVVTPSHDSHAHRAPEKPKDKAAEKPAAAVPAAPPPPAPEPAAEKPVEPPKGTTTGLPVPRWASLRSDEVNLRTGPGTRYPIDWVYKRRDLPVQIEREFEVWRLIEDQDGVKGWVHSATLVGRRSFVVTGQPRMLRSAASDDADPVALLKPGVVGHLRACAAGAAWCEVQVGEYRGWLKRTDFWGSFADEAVTP